jgi:hypothetical protein
VSAVPSCIGVLSTLLAEISAQHGCWWRPAGRSWRVGVARQGRVRWVGVARDGHPIRPAELAQLCAHAAVPEGAQRVSARGQGRHRDMQGDWWLVGYWWEE